MKNLLALWLFVACFLPEAMAQGRMSIGLSGNYGSYNSFGGEIYARKPVRLFKKDADDKGRLG